MFKEEYIQKIRNGLIIKGQKVNFWCELIRKQNTNTWLNIKTHENSLVNLRLIFRKLSLRVNRLIRVSYGPFSLKHSNKPGYINQVEIPRTVGNYLYYHQKEKLSFKQEKIDKTKLKAKKEQELFYDKVLKLAEDKKKRLKKIASSPS